MNNFRTHAESAELADNRTAYSLAREVLGLRAQLAEMRDTLGNMEAEEGQEITALRQELEAASDAASDMATTLDLVRKVLGVTPEPHQGMAERILEALDRKAKIAATAERFARARGRYHSQNVMCDLLEIFDLPCSRPVKGEPA